MSIPRNLRQQVIQAANHRCEYCQTSSRLTGTPLVMEHILPRSLGGTDERENLAAACYRCNEFKGAKTAALDPETGQLVPLFNPRIEQWPTHFSWGNGGTHIIGMTPTGRATVVALRLNNDNIVAARAMWIESAWHPPNE
ncbi:HNH endonuclease [Halomicronema sp. CCY15110]|uniref:HNH endonuclease n=1 Tax=Halomicronema sp. CCY15110 TaxID=2767773 RepID=UPI00194DF028|nr:HNH endonuclease signature motif containing protein [Halomicronema sp. CCY15110]